LEIECAEAEILDRLRALPDAAQAIEVVRPTLDDVYARFLRDEQVAT
jgi:hypothetical protein